MAEDYNVFISWSGARGKRVAELMHGWLPIVVQSAKPWMSSANIDAGSRGLDEVVDRLQGIKVGIVCLTPESLNAPWILYESGALSKTVDDKTRLCTYLLGDLEFQDVKAPLGMFQATKADEEGTLRLVHTINKTVSNPPIPDQNLQRLFDKMWPELADALKTVPKSDAVAVVKRPTDDIVAEILEISRAQANNIKSLENQILSMVWTVNFELTKYGMGSPSTGGVALKDLLNLGQTPRSADIFNIRDLLAHPNPTSRPAKNKGAKSDDEGNKPPKKKE